MDSLLDFFRREVHASFDHICLNLGLLFKGEDFGPISGRILYEGKSRICSVGFDLRDGCVDIRLGQGQLPSAIETWYGGNSRRLDTILGLKNYNNWNIRDETTLRETIQYYAVHLSHLSDWPG